VETLLALVEQRGLLCCLALGGGTEIVAGEVVLIEVGISSNFDLVVLVLLKELFR
jgi:hypothetical protein